MNTIILVLVLVALFLAAFYLPSRLKAKRLQRAAACDPMLSAAATYWSDLLRERKCPSRSIEKFERRFGQGMLEAKSRFGTYPAQHHYAVHHGRCANFNTGTVLHTALVRSFKKCPFTSQNSLPATVNMCFFENEVVVTMHNAQDSRIVVYPPQKPEPPVQE